MDYLENFFFSCKIKFVVYEDINFESHVSCNIIQP